MTKIVKKAPSRKKASKEVLVRKTQEVETYEKIELRVLTKKEIEDIAYKIVDAGYDDLKSRRYRKALLFKELREFFPDVNVEDNGSFGFLDRFRDDAAQSHVRETAYTVMSVWKDLVSRKANVSVLLDIVGYVLADNEPVMEDVRKVLLKSVARLNKLKRYQESD